MKYLHLSYIIQIKHCPIRGLSTNLWKIQVTRTRNLHPTHRRSFARFVESNVCTQAIHLAFYIDNNYFSFINYSNCSFSFWVFSFFLIKYFRFFPNLIASDWGRGSSIIVSVYSISRDSSGINFVIKQYKVTHEEQEIQYNENSEKIHIFKSTFRRMLSHHQNYESY